MSEDFKQTLHVKKWWQVLLFVCASLFWIDKMHNFGGFKFENFKSEQALETELLKMCPIGTTDTNVILKALRKAGAECHKIPKTNFINPFDIPKATEYKWFCNYWTTWLPFKGRTKYIVEICIDSNAEVIAIISGMWTYMQFFL